MVNDCRFQIYSIPLIEIQPREADLETLDFQRIEWLFFTSSNSVLHFFNQLVDPAVVNSIKIAVIGSQTAKMVRSFGLVPIFQPTEYSSDQFIQQWQIKYGNQQCYRILLPKSDLARSNIKLELEAQGHQVSEKIVYQNILPEKSKEKLAGLLVAGKIDCVLFTSPSAWHRYDEVAQKLALEKELLYGAIGPITDQAIRASGAKGLLPLDESYTMESLLKTVMLHYTN
ncbi:uroporphyrinogen-III synthase [Carnobacterium gallinarum]|uniref:uroporphyrinogen-III synthase n=1 Tax=Carnobacterium gallinarum TaxID=2749 RepID=UPI000550FA62|nr:uroporphyrinogen-III synthase [Carnobacterium gallinarum]